MFYNSKGLTLTFLSLDMVHCAQADCANDDKYNKKTVNDQSKNSWEQHGLSGQKTQNGRNCGSELVAGQIYLHLMRSV